MGVNGGLGIHLSGQGHLIKDCTAYDNYAGIDCTRGCVVLQNTAYNNHNDGIEVGEGCSVISNTAYDNDGGNFTGCASDCTVGENYMP